METTQLSREDKAQLNLLTESIVRLAETTEKQTKLLKESDPTKTQSPPTSKVLMSLHQGLDEDIETQNTDLSQWEVISPPSETTNTVVQFRHYNRKQDTTRPNIDIEVKENERKDEITNNWVLHVEDDPQLNANTPNHVPDTQLDVSYNSLETAITKALEEIRTYNKSSLTT
jgi:hypothetical protein